MRSLPPRLLAALLFVSLGTPWVGTPAAATPAPVPECRAQPTGERPSATADDIVNCVYTRLGPGRVRLSAAYTYASPLGKENIWMGVDVLAGGNRLKWFGYRPVSITASSGTVSVELIFGVNNPPARSLSTDQVELFLYVGGGQIFFRKVFTLKLDWQL